MGKMAKLNKKEKAKQEEPFDLKKEIISWVEVIVIAVVLAWFLTSFVIVNAVVPSGSMEDTILPGNRLLGLRLTYLFSEPQRGDIVVFHYPVDEAVGEKTNFIKRIIGLPGETVTIRDGKIYIDDATEPLEEPYLKEAWLVENDGYVFHVPEDSYLMLGDNRNNSSDARYWTRAGMIALGEVNAEDALKLTPKAAMESGSEKARSLAYVSRSQILGKAYFRYWPLTAISGLYGNS